METTDILTVKEKESGYLVNGFTSVPNVPGNRYYQAVQKWIAEGNTPAPIETPEEKADRERRELDAITITRFQLKASLDHHNVLDELQTFIDHQDTPRLVKLGWTDGQRFNRGGNLIAQVIASMGWTEQFADDVFVYAKDIED